MRKVPFRKLGIFLFLLAAIAIYKSLNIGQYLTFASLKANQSLLDHYYQGNPLFVSGLFFVVYVLTTAFSLL